MKREFTPNPVHIAQKGCLKLTVKTEAMERCLTVSGSQILTMCLSVVIIFGFSELRVLCHLMSRIGLSYLQNNHIIIIILF